jgi:predicted nucleic acid-binding protein
VYLVDTDVASEARKGGSANPGVRRFFREVSRRTGRPVYLSVVTIGELRRGVEIVRHRGDNTQASLLDRWLANLTERFAESILPVDEEVAQIWGRLRVPNPENPLDKLIAATALIHNLTVVTRNVRHFDRLGVDVLDPFD